ncbi:hypothetical protein NC652_010091 [Populus alba x Populus x berolinensis]|uniref:Uncharacterized protein n=3 Tax=Populus TaxID=3689 RepID=A0ACC4CE16_POPAL|nr:hypothetical protein NC652_010091 [Populus alba x Populus x berolinensis]KAJ6999325.1 hypothetical protein NC653_010117 [Populus alba x Populus x berolinensis]TKR90127.1 hypothetical protein D5086_0000236520 [Populus alba]
MAKESGNTSKFEEHDMSGFFTSGGSEGKEQRKPCLDGVASLLKCNLLFASTRKFDGLVANYMEVANVVVDCRGTTLVGVTGMCGGGGFEVKEATTKVDDADEDTYWLSSLK